MTRELPTFENVRLVAHDDLADGATGVIELVLDRPAAMNAVSSAMARDLAAATRALADDPGVRAVVQPGGSMRDAEVIEAAEAAGVTMYFTGERHFFH